MLGKSKVQARIEFLAALEHGEIVTQTALAKRVTVSVGLINAWLKRAGHKGYVKAKAAPYKRYAYYLTPKGFAEKARLVAEYLEDSLAFFRTARAEYAVLFAQSQARGVRRVILVGAGELAEIAFLASREYDIEILGILDQSFTEARFCGMTVRPALDDYHDVDAVVITASRHPQDAFDLVREPFTDLQLLAPPLLRLVRTSLDFKEPNVAPIGARK